MSLISGIEKFFLLRSGMPRFSVETVLSHRTKTFRRVILHFVTNLRCRKIFSLGALCHVFLSSMFCLTVPNHFAREPFSVSLVTVNEFISA